MPADWKKIFTNHVSDEGLIFKIHKELIQLNNLKNIFKWPEEHK